MAPIRAIIFDLGHTLWDLHHSAENRRARIDLMLALLADDGIEPPAADPFDRALGLAFAAWWQDGRGGLEQPPSQRFVRDALASTGVTCPDPRLVEVTDVLFGTEADVPSAERDTIETLAALDARGLALGCVTNTLLLERGIVDLLERNGIAAFFGSIVVSSAMGYRKPHASLFQKALEDLGVEPGHALFVGDDPVADIGGAKALGMRAVLTQQYRCTPLDGVAPTPDAIIQRLSELPGVIQQLQGLA